MAGEDADEDGGLGDQDWPDDEAEAVDVARRREVARREMGRDRQRERDDADKYRLATLDIGEEDDDRHAGHQEPQQEAGDHGAEFGEAIDHQDLSASMARSGEAQPACPMVWVETRPVTSQAPSTVAA